jgi:copper transport protein
VLSLAYLVTFAFAGHASTSPHRAWTVASDVLHVGAMSLWLGGLVMILVVARTPTRTELLRFSRLAAICVLVLVATGTYQSWLHVGSWAALPATSYGRELLVKVGILVLVLGAAALTRSRVHRPLVVHAATLDTVPSNEAALPAPDVRRTVLVEAVGVIAILAVTAALVATQPARTAYRPSVDTRLHLGPDIAQVSAVPSGDRQMDLHLFLFDHRGLPVHPPEVRATVSLPEAEIGPLEVPLQKAGASHYVGTVAVPRPGGWTLAVTIRTTAIDEYTEAVTLPIR